MDDEASWCGPKVEGLTGVITFIMKTCAILHTFWCCALCREIFLFVFCVFFVYFIFISFVFSGVLNSSRGMWCYAYAGYSHPNVRYFARGALSPLAYFLGCYCTDFSFNGTQTTGHTGVRVVKVLGHNSTHVSRSVLQV